MRGVLLIAVSPPIMNAAIEKGEMIIEVERFGDETTTFLSFLDDIRQVLASQPKVR